MTLLEKLFHFSQKQATILIVLPNSRNTFILVVRKSLWSSV